MINLAKKLLKNLLFLLILLKLTILKNEPWGPLPGGRQGGRPPPPPDFGGKFFNTFRPPPRFWRVL